MVPAAGLETHSPQGFGTDEHALTIAIGSPGDQGIVLDRFGLLGQGHQHPGRRLGADPGRDVVQRRDFLPYLDGLIRGGGQRCRGADQPGLGQHGTRRIGDGLPPAGGNGNGQNVGDRRLQIGRRSRRRACNHQQRTAAFPDQFLHEFQLPRVERRRIDVAQNDEVKRQGVADLYGELSQVIVGNVR